MSTLILDPTAPSHNAPRQAGRTLDTLAGKVIGFIDNSKPNFSVLVDDLAQLFMQKHGAKTVIKRSKHAASVPAPDEVMQELISQCDLVITGSGD
jgi:hypothetical protein